MKWVQHRSLYLAWMIALVGVLISLYYGEILQMEPCRLCWYQRIGLFPLALFLGIATYKDDVRLAFYCLPLVFFGGAFALYQSMIQLFPILQISALCGEVSCTLAGILPWLSLFGFALIAILILKKSEKR